MQGRGGTTTNRRHNNGLHTQVGLRFRGLYINYSNCFIFCFSHHGNKTVPITPLRTFMCRYFYSSNDACCGRSPPVDAGLPPPPYIPIKCIPY